MISANDSASLGTPQDVQPALRCVMRIRSRADSNGDMGSTRLIDSLSAVLGGRLDSVSCGGPDPLLCQFHVTGPVVVVVR